jgi:hypothetical protein
MHGTADMGEELKKMGQFTLATEVLLKAIEA